MNILHNFMTLEGLGIPADSEIKPRRAVKPAAGLDIDQLIGKSGNMEL